MIINPTPIATALFDGYWITNAQLVVGAGKLGILQARLRPYDGTHLLATGTRHVNELDVAAKAAADPMFGAMLDSLHATVARLSGNAVPFNLLQVNAPSPDKPVMLAALWEAAETAPASRYRIPDAYALAASDSDFATTFAAAMAAIAALAGFTVS